MAFAPAQNRFQQGSPVEVAGRRDGHIGAYYLATVLEDLGDKHKVEYPSLLDDEDEGRQLQEEVDADQLRPRPPPPPEQEQNGEFDVLDRVDVDAMDAWWVGTITKVTEEGPSKKCTVYFETTGEHVDYSREKLRFHKDWIDGAWVDCESYVGIEKKVEFEENFEDRYKTVRIDGKLVNCKDK